MEELRVQSLQCLLQDRVGGRSVKTKSLEEVRIGVELGHEGSVPESGGLPKVEIRCDTILLSLINSSSKN